jgi:hypothetical protein
MAQDKPTDARLQQLFADWTHRHQKFKSARYVISGTMQEVGSRLPPGHPGLPRRYVLLLDFEGKRYRIESSEEWHDSKGELTTRMITLTWDGKSWYRNTHRELTKVNMEEADLSIGTEARKGNMLQSELRPVMFAHGLVPTVGTELRMNNLPPRYDPKTFEVGQAKSLHGRTGTEVRTVPREHKGAPTYPAMCHDEFLIDFQQRGAIHEYRHFASSEPWDAIEVAWKKDAHGWWLERWTHTWFDAGAVHRTMRLEVESFEPNSIVTDDDFTLPAKPGMKVTVAHPSTPGNPGYPHVPDYKYYIVLSSGKWKEVDEKDFASIGKMGLLGGHGAMGLWWAIVALVLVVGIAYYLFRHRRGEQTK